MGTLYNTPEEYGLEVVGEFDWCEPDYSFDMLVVWKESRGKYWIGEDSNCSCPSPFEDFYDINTLDGPYNKKGLSDRLAWLVKDRCGSGYNRSEADLRRDVSDILSKLS